MTLTANGRINGNGLGAPPKTEPVFDAEGITMQRRMRFNPLRALNPENLSLALDQFDLGILRQAALLWDAMGRRDDTLSFVWPQLENAIAGKPWGVFKRKNADETEAARHAAALEYFYGSVTAIDAFDRNIRGDRHLLLKQMSASYAMRYAVHHFVWKPQPGKMIDVEGAAPVPALTAELEYVPLWFFENVSGTLRFLPFGGFGIEGQELNWEGEWMVTTGAGMMFAASICYVFKRLTFQDWTIFNERYAQQKVIAQTPEGRESEQGQAMASIVRDFNGDQGIILYGSTPGDKPPISLIGPEGTVTVDVFERFLDRQDRKMTVMFRGSDLRNMSREKDTTGVSAQTQETEALEMAHCASIASACRTFIDRAVIRYCFGDGVEPLAYFGLPDMDDEDAQQLLESAGFLADRGALVEMDTVAERLGVTLTEDPEEALTATGGGGVSGGDAEHGGRDAHPTRDKTENAARRLRKLVEQANGKFRTANAAEHEMKLSVVVCTANIAGVADGEWALIAPYGDHTAPDGSYVQRFSREQAEKVVTTWNSVTGMAARVFKNLFHGLGAKRTLPIWDGHPETDKRRWPIEKLLGEVSELRTGNDGLEGRVTWNDRGAEERTHGPLFPSPLWWHWPPAGEPPSVFPELLESIGLVTTPNISGVPAWTANATLAGNPQAENQELEQTDNIMDKKKLIELLGLAADATDDQIELALKSAGTTANALATANAAKAGVETQLTTANSQVTALTTERDGLKTANTALTTEVESLRKGVLDLAEKKGAITPAERQAFADRLATANTAPAALTELQTRKALNVSHIEINNSRIDLSTANARQNALNDAVEKRMADEKCDYDTAFAKVRADKNFAPLFDAMQDPTKKGAA